MTNETVFIDAENGGVGVYIGAGNKVGFAKTAKMLAYILDTHKILVRLCFVAQWILQPKLVSQMMVMQENCLMMQ